MLAWGLPIAPASAVCLLPAVDRREEGEETPSGLGWRPWRNRAYAPECFDAHCRSSRGWPAGRLWQEQHTEQRDERRFEAGSRRCLVVEPCARLESGVC